MKILIINQHISDALGGSEMQCDLIAHGLTNLGHQVIYGFITGMGVMSLSLLLF
jgi:hypothetical protein